MSEPLTPNNLNESIASSGGFPAKTYRTPADAPDYPASVLDSTGNYCAAFAWYDRSTRCWRTWQRCCIEGWERFSATWPRSGMARNGIAYQRAPSALCITEIESLSRRFVPTPAACDYKGSGRPRRNRGPGNNLRDWFRQNYGWLYPPVRLVEYLMGFPKGFTDLKDSATP